MGIVINDDSNGVAVYTYTLDVTKYNPNHGSNGQFASGGGGGGGGTGGTANVSDAQEDLSNRAKGAQDASDRIKVDGSKNSQNNQATQRKERLQGAADGFDTAAGVVGKPDQMKALAQKYPKRDYNSNLDAYKTGFHDAIQSAVADYGDLK